jgi:hypothetical protein
MYGTKELCLHFESSWVDRTLIQIFAHIPHYRQTMRVRQTYTTQKGRQSGKVQLPTLLKPWGRVQGTFFCPLPLEVSTKILCALRTYLPSCDQSNNIL